MRAALAFTPSESKRLIAKREPHLRHRRHPWRSRGSPWLHQRICGRGAIGLLPATRAVHLGPGDQRSAVPDCARGKASDHPDQSRPGSWGPSRASTESIAKRENCSVRKVNMTISLAFLAPDLVRAAIQGRLPHGMGVTRLADLPVEWSRQHQVLGLPAQ